MRKSIMLIIGITLIFMECMALEPNKNEKETEYFSLTSYAPDFMNNSLSNTEYNLSLMNLQVDVLGFLFFGPQITLDFQFANMIAVGPYFRYNYAGLVYQGIVTDWFSDETTTSLASFSYGAQAKFLIPVGSGQHRPYIEVGFEKSIGSDSYNTGGTYGKRIYEYESNVFHFNAGYRLISSSSFNLSAAIGIGVSTDTKSIGYYEFDDEFIDNYTLETRVLPMIQLMLGWQLGK